MKINSLALEPTTGATNDMVAAITDKQGYGARWKFSSRHIDNLLAKGLPHCKVGARRVRILIPEADAWMKDKYFIQRLKKPRKITANNYTREGSSDPREDSTSPQSATGLLTDPVLDNHPQN